MKNDIEALRGFANVIIKDTIEQNSFVHLIIGLAKDYGLLDKDGNKTELLTGSKDRIGDAQRRLYWAWMTDMSKTQVEAMKGRTKEDWHWEMKLKYLVPIFIRDDSEFAAMHSVYRDCMIINRLYLQNQKIIKEKFLGQLSITDATREQATEYLKDIENYCWNNGIMLRTNEALYKLIFGK